MRRRGCLTSPLFYLVSPFWLRKPCCDFFVHQVRRASLCLRPLFLPSHIPLVAGVRASTLDRPVQFRGFIVTLCQSLSENPNVLLLF